MKLFYGIVLVLMVFVSACAQQPAAEPEAQPTAPEPSPTPEAAPEAEEESEAEAEATVAAPEVDSQDVRYVGASGFEPDELTISAGSSVTFFNDDSKNMVVIVFKDGRKFATPRLNPGQQAEVEFTEPGKYDFWLNLPYAPVGGKITVE